MNIRAWQERLPKQNTQKLNFIRLNTATFIRVFKIRVRRLLEGGAYWRAAFIGGRRLLEGGVYWRAAFIKNLIYFLQIIVWQLTILIE